MWSQKNLGKIGLILKHRNVKIFFETFWKKCEKIFTSLILKISPIFCQKIFDAEPHNLTELWTQLKKRLFL